MNEYNKAETNSGRENKLVVISGERGREMSQCEKEIQDVINKTNMMQRYSVQQREHSLYNNCRWRISYKISSTLLYTQG